MCMAYLIAKFLSPLGLLKDDLDPPPGFYDPVRQVFTRYIGDLSHCVVREKGGQK